MIFILASLASVEVSYLHAIIYAQLLRRLVLGGIDTPWHFIYYKLAFALVIRSTEWGVSDAAAFRATQATETNPDSEQLVLTNHPTLHCTVPKAPLRCGYLSVFLLALVLFGSFFEIKIGLP